MLSKTFGERIKEARERKQLSLRAVAEACGLSTSTISRLERGIFAPNYDNAARLAEVLQVEVDPVADLLKAQFRTAGEIERSKTELASIIRMRRMEMQTGKRWNITKIALRGNFNAAILIRGALQIRSNNGFAQNVKSPVRLDGKLLMSRIYFATATEFSELIWIG